jgi:ElaB/YqjD/DUF883 family membrane-anchored ribosome-binding protein
MDRALHESADDARTEAAALRQRAQATTPTMREALTRAAFELDTVAAVSDAEDSDRQS